MKTGSVSCPSQIQNSLELLPCGLMWRAASSWVSSTPKELKLVTARSTRTLTVTLGPVTSKTSHVRSALPNFSFCSQPRVSFRTTGRRIFWISVRFGTSGTSSRCTMLCVMASLIAAPPMAVQTLDQTLLSSVSSRIMSFNSSARSFRSIVVKSGDGSRSAFTMGSMGTRYAAMGVGPDLSAPVSVPPIGDPCAGWLASSVSWVCRAGISASAGIAAPSFFGSTVWAFSPVDLPICSKIIVCVRITPSFWPRLSCESAWACFLSLANLAGTSLTLFWISVNAPPTPCHTFAQNPGEGGGSGSVGPSFPIESVRRSLVLSCTCGTSVKDLRRAGGMRILSVWMSSSSRTSSLPKCSESEDPWLFLVRATADCGEAATDRLTMSMRLLDQ
mmetsp:Transcript_132382/g.229569  ORF Transcript_132382/g.229569 Transcript_132382/m.229569 type:complete len:388 (+) Transcript_132382:616-1779(+)